MSAFRERPALDRVDSTARCPDFQGREQPAELGGWSTAIRVSSPPHPPHLPSRSPTVHGEPASTLLCANVGAHGMNESRL